MRPTAGRLCACAGDGDGWAAAPLCRRADSDGACVLRAAAHPLPSPAPVRSACSGNQLDAEGGTAVAQALQHLPQLRVLDLGCARA